MKGMEYTYHIPEPEPSLDLRPRILYSSKGILTNLQSHAFGILDPWSIRVPYSLPSINVRKSVQVHFGQDAEPGIDLRLER